jgi:ABC-2 type transport system ATP-binding protein
VTTPESAPAHLPSPEAALSVRGVWKRYRRRAPWALADVTLDVAMGRTVALVGPNGAGKSTLLRTWLGFERATSGQVRAMGVDPWQDRGRAIRFLGYIPQVPSLYDELSVAEHVELAAYLRKGMDRSRALARVDELGLPRRARADELSGGQRAQLALALVLAAGARTLLLDEPLASLDPLARREFLGVLARSAKTSGATVVISSHLVTDVAEAAQDLVILVAGRVRLGGTIMTLRAEHAVMPPDLAPADSLVGVFPTEAGAAALVRASPARHPDAHSPTLEELVLGYLAAPEPSNATRPE